MGHCVGTEILTQVLLEEQPTLLNTEPSLQSPSFSQKVKEGHFLALNVTKASLGTPDPLLQCTNAGIQVYATTSRPDNDLISMRKEYLFSKCQVSFSVPDLGISLIRPARLSQPIPASKVVCFFYITAFIPSSAS